MVSTIIAAIAVLAFTASFWGKPKLTDWPLRTFAIALVLTLVGALL